MKKFPILLLIIFLISSCSNDDSVIFEFEKEIVKSKISMKQFDENNIEFNKYTESIDTNYSINANVIVDGKKLTNFFNLNTQKDFEEFQKQYQIAINSVGDFFYDSFDFNWGIHKFERNGQKFISLYNNELLDFQIEIEQKDWNYLLNPKWKIKYFSDVLNSDLTSQRKEITKDEFLKIKD